MLLKRTKSQFEEYYFHKGRSDINYRDSALNQCLTDRLNFEMTENNENNIIQNFIEVKCPECNTPMEYRYNSLFRCCCGNEIYLSINKFRMDFSKKEVFKVEELEGEIIEGEIPKKIIPIKAWITKDDIEGKVVAKVGRIGKLVRVDYLNNRARTDSKIQALIEEISLRLKNED